MSAQSTGGSQPPPPAQSLPRALDVDPVWPEEYLQQQGRDAESNGNVNGNAALPSIAALVPLGSRLRIGGGRRGNVLFVEGRGDARLTAVLLYASSGTLEADLEEARRAGVAVILVVQSSDAGFVDSCQGALQQLTSMGVHNTGLARDRVKVLLEVDQGGGGVAQRVSAQLAQLMPMVLGGGGAERVGIMATHESANTLTAEFARHPLCLVHPNRGGQRPMIGQMRGLLAGLPVPRPWQERGIDMWVVDQPTTLEPIEGEAKLVVVADRLG